MKNKVMLAKKILLSLSLLLFLGLAINAPAIQAGPLSRSVTGIVTKVSDGDTVHLTTPEQTKLKVRLYGIDAPETVKMNYRTGVINKPGQPYGNESWTALEHKIKGKYVRLEIINVDQYRRMVSIIYLDNRNINLEMVREGYAEAYIEYLKTPYRALFLKAEDEAKAERLGIWSLDEYERPCVFRKKLKINGG